MCKRVGRVYRIKRIGRCYGGKSRHKTKGSERKGKRKEVAAKALLNLGYESDVPEVIIPLNVARSLGFLPELPSDVSSGKFTARKIPEGVEITWVRRN